MRERQTEELAVQQDSYGKRDKVTDTHTAQKVFYSNSVLWVTGNVPLTACFGIEIGRA